MILYIMTRIQIITFVADSIKCPYRQKFIEKVILVTTVIFFPYFLRFFSFFVFIYLCDFDDGNDAILSTLSINVSTACTNNSDRIGISNS